jgi:hypothetical protein
MAAAFQILDEYCRTGKVSWGILMNGVEAYANKTDDRKWANPKTWLIEERWNDRPGKPNGAHGVGGESDNQRMARQVAAREAAGNAGAKIIDIGGSEIGGDDARHIPARRLG